MTPFLTPFLLPSPYPTCMRWHVIKVMTIIQKLSGNGNVAPQFMLQHDVPVWIVEKIARISRPLIQQGLLCVNTKVVELGKGIDQCYCSTDSNTLRYDGPKNGPSVNQHSKRALYSDSKLVGRESRRSEAAAAGSSKKNKKNKQRTEP